MKYRAGRPRDINSLLKGSTELHFNFRLNTSLMIYIFRLALVSIYDVKNFNTTTQLITINLLRLNSRLDLRSQELHYNQLATTQLWLEEEEPIRPIGQVVWEQFVVVPKPSRGHVVSNGRRTRRTNFNCTPILQLDDGNSLLLHCGKRAWRTLGADSTCG